MRLPLALALLFASAFTTVVHADPVKIYAAGSLSAVLPELITASGLPASSVAAPIFGPAGLLRQRIENGEVADLYLSADLAQPEHVAAARGGGPVVPFARNRTCAVGAGSLGLTASNLLDRMLDPAVHIGTSTPGADPGGDYAQAVFARAERLHRGAQAVLQAKAQAMFGGPNSMVPADGHSPGGAALLDHRADVLIYYCSSAAPILTEVPGTVSIPLPPALEPGPVYGLTVLGSNPDAARLALFILSGPGQAILATRGLLPVLASADGVTVMGTDAPPAQLSVASLRALPPSTATVHGEGGAATQFSGPTLWSVLQQAGAVQPNFHKRVDQVVTITGLDGYSVSLGLGEIDPEFENKPVILATERDGAALDVPRLAVPDDKRPGRSVRDVANISVR